MRLAVFAVMSTASLARAVPRASISSASETFSTAAVTTATCCWLSVRPAAGTAAAGAPLAGEPAISSGRRLT